MKQMRVMTYRDRLELLLSNGIDIVHFDESSALLVDELTASYQFNPKDDESFSKALEGILKELGESK